jgi:hypothetical protein
MTLFDRGVYAALAAVIGGGLVFIFVGSAGARSPDPEIKLIFGVPLLGATASAVLGWFFGEKVLDRLSEVGPSWWRS